MTGHVDVTLADQIKALAKRGERSVSREVSRALRRHLAAESSLDVSESMGPRLEGGSFEPAQTPQSAAGPPNIGEAVEPAGARGDTE